MYWIYKQKYKMKDWKQHYGVSAFYGIFEINFFLLIFTYEILLKTKPIKRIK